MDALLFWGSLIIALWIVPRYLWRVYGGADGVRRLVEFMLSIRPAPIADEADGRTDGRSVPQDDLYCPRLGLDRSKVAAIEVMLYNGWGTADIRSILKGSNETIGLEVDAARVRLGIDPPDNKTPIAQRPTDAQFASDVRR